MQETIDFKLEKINCLTEFDSSKSFIHASIGYLFQWSHWHLGMTATNSLKLGKLIGFIEIYNYNGFIENVEIFVCLITCYYWNFCQLSILPIATVIHY